MSWMRACWVALAVTASAQPLWAGAVYVPFAADVQIDNIRYQTQVWASNKGIENRRLATYFILAGSNGATRPADVTYGSVTVAGLTTSLLTDITPLGQVGLLELTGAPQMFIKARLVPVGLPDGLGASLPVISSENLLAANTTAYLQGLARDTNRVTDLAVVNIAQTQASCTLNYNTASGGSLGAAAVVTVPPLSMLRYADLLNTLGQPQISAVRASVTCDKTFYTYAVTFQRETGAVSVAEPAQLLSSTLVRPGDSPPPPTGCQTGAICFERPGTFFTQVPPAIFHIEYFDLPPGTYHKVHFRVEVYHGGWGNLSGPGGLHSLFWLVRDRNFDLIGFSVFRKPPRNDVMFRHGIGIEATQKPKYFKPINAVAGQTYVMDYTYDLTAHHINFDIKDLAGNVIVNFTDVPNVNALTMNAGQRLRADFGFNEGRNENEDPGYGWKYSNLTMEVFP